jgi:hypothetical protein
VVKIEVEHLRGAGLSARAARVDPVGPVFSRRPTVGNIKVPSPA